MTEEHTSAPQKKRRWVLPLLFVSLALNLLVVGIVVGAMFQGGGKDRDGRPMGPARSVLGEPFVRALEPSDRVALGREIIANRDQLSENRSVLRSRVERLLEQLREEEFDREAVSALLSEQRSLAVNRQEVGEVLLLNRLEDMSVEERRAYADRLGESLMRFRRK